MKKTVGLKLAERSAGGPVATFKKPWNDKMSSWINGSRRNARWYDNAGGGGRCHTLVQGGSDNDLSDSNNDKLSSWATDGSCEGK